MLWALSMLAAVLIPRPGSDAASTGSASQGVASWQVVGRPLPERFGALHHPQILVRPDGSLLAYVEHTGHYGSKIGSYVYQSTDRGECWTQVATLYSPASATLFEFQGSPCLLGVEGSRGSAPAVLRRSADGGVTWRDAEMLGGPKFRGAGAGAPVVQGARLWQVFARVYQSDQGFTQSLAVASAPIDTGLQSTSWEWTRELLLTGYSGFVWDLSVLVPGQGSTPTLIGRNYGHSPRFVADLATDKNQWVIRDGPAPAPPAGQVRSSRLDKDPKTGDYLVLTSDPSQAEDNSALVLQGSKDLMSWTPRTTLVRKSPGSATRFGHADWAIDGEDLVVLVRADLPAGAGSKSANRTRSTLLFLRVPKFRERTEASAPVEIPGTK